MNMDIHLSESDTKEISICLHEIYEAVIFDNNVVITNYMITDIAIESIEEQNEIDKIYFIEHRDSALACDSHNKLAKRFLSKINHIIEDAFNIASKMSTTYSNVTDIMAVTVPYVLLKFGVGNKEVGLFASLGIIISKIIIDRITEKIDRKSKVYKDDLLKLLQMSTLYLESINESEQTEHLIQYKESLTSLMKDIERSGS